MNTQPLIMNVANKYAMHLLIAAIFFIPVSTALLNIFFVLFLLTTLLNKNIPNLLSQSWNNPISRYAILLFIFFLIGSTWSIGEPDEIIESINKYSKFLFIALIIPYFQQPESRKRAIHTILYSSYLILFFIYLLYLNIIPSNFFTETVGLRFSIDGGFKTHIINSIILTFSGYILLNQYLSSEQKNHLHIAGACLFFFYTLFISTGTSGQVLTIVMIATAVIQHYRTKSIMILPVIFASITIYGLTSDTALHYAKDRLEQVTNSYETNKTSGSVPTRLHQFLSSIDLIQQRPLFGYGTGGTREAFIHHLPEDSVINRRDINHPHSEYPLIAIQLGLTGLVAFIGMLFYQLLHCKQIRDPELRNLAIGFTIFIAVNCLGNPMIYMSGEGHFWAIFTAVLFASISPQESDEISTNSV